MTIQEKQNIPWTLPKALNGKARVDLVKLDMLTSTIGKAFHLRCVSSNVKKMLKCLDIISYVNKAKLCRNW